MDNKNGNNMGTRGPYTGLRVYCSTGHAVKPSEELFKVWMKLFDTERPHLMTLPSIHHTNISVCGLMSCMWSGSGRTLDKSLVFLLNYSKCFHSWSVPQIASVLPYTASLFSSSLIFFITDQVVNHIFNTIFSRVSPLICVFSEWRL